MKRKCNGSKCIADIVSSNYFKLYTVAGRYAVMNQIKRAVAIIIISDIGSAVFCVSVNSISDYLAGDTVCDFVDIRYFVIDYQNAVLRKKFCIFMERIADIQYDLFCSVADSCLGGSSDCTTPGSSVLHYLLEFARVGDAI